MSATQFNQERLLQILLAPQVSEKATMVAERSNQVVFVVASDATKPEIRAAVESLFNVRVTGVQVANAKGKSKRFGRSMGRRSDVRKAFISLEPGQEINFAEGVA